MGVRRPACMCPHASVALTLGFLCPSAWCHLSSQQSRLKKSRSEHVTASAVLLKVRNPTVLLLPAGATPASWGTPQQRRPLQAPPSPAPSAAAQAARSAPWCPPATSAPARPGAAQSCRQALSCVVCMAHICSSRLWCQSDSGSSLLQA